MNIRYVKHVNVDNGNTEFLLVNYDFRDGIEIVADYFKEKYSMNIKDVIDGIWFKMIKLEDTEKEYHLYWDEDSGNYLLSVQQDDASIHNLENKVIEAVEYLNKV